MRTAIILCAVATAACTAFSGTENDPSVSANALRSSGHAATFSTQGDLDPTNAFHTAQGTNGRSCASCHLPDGGWSITPAQVERAFADSAGEDPLFLLLDANHPNAPVSTLEEKRASYSMLRKGLFRRGGTPPATRDFDIVAAEDPFGWGSTSPQRFSVFRRPLATANFHLTKNVGWDDANTRSGQTVPDGLFAQAANNIVTGQGGAQPANETVQSIVDYELSLSFAQIIVPGVGRLDQDGGRGGPELLSKQAFVSGRFDLFDAWSGSPVPARAAIARGQELFNAKCLGCHNAANNGSNVDGRLFDVGASDERWASVDGLPVYTVKNRTTGAEIRTTDPGKANRSGKWTDMNRFKVPSLRGLSARAPYFHNGVAKDLLGVVRFYEDSRGFEFTSSEETDLVAFLNAL
jgi:cytochrome c peroxidase